MARAVARNVLAVAVVMACLLLAACGGPTTARQTRTPPVPSPTPTTGTVALTGCTSLTPPPGARSADVVVTQGGGPDSPPISLRTGQRMEIQLPASYHWALSTQEAGQVLVPQAGNGWLAASARVCVWQFTASAVGRATLLFTGRPVCAPGTLCPAIVIERTYVVDVA